MAKNHKIRIFESGIEKAARMLSDKYDIKVVWRHGGSPATDGKTIEIPALPEDASEELMNATHGYIDHESAHILFSQMDLIKPKLEEVAASKPILKMAWNALEDCRIEDRLKRRFPGCARNLRNMNEYVNRIQTNERDEEGKTAWEKADALFKTIISFYIFNANSRDNDHWFWCDHVEHEYKQFVYDNIDLLDRVHNIDNAPEVFSLAEELLKRMNLSEEFKEEQVKAPSPKSKEKPEDKDEGDEEQDNSSSGSDKEENKDEGDEEQDNGSSDEGKSGDKESSGGKGSDEDNQEDGESNSGNSEEQDEGNTVTKRTLKVTARVKNSDGSEINIDVTQEQFEQSMSSNSIAEMIERAAKQEFEESESPYNVYTNEGDEYVVMEPKSNDRQLYHTYENMISSRARVVKRKIARALITATYSRWDYGKDKGKINRRAIHKVVSGTSSRVFKQKGEDLSYDTSALLLVDHSGSMSGNRMVTAMQTAALMGDVLNQLDIPFSVVGFSTNVGHEGYARWQSASESERNMFQRWGNLWLGVYKGFNDIWQHKKFRLAQMPSNVRTNTYDGESVRAGARLLLSRNEKRKILFIINDGEPCPNGPDSHAEHDKFAKLIGHEVGKYVEVVAIGIQSDSIGNYYPKAININSIDQLSGAVLNQLVRLLKPKF